MTTTGRYIGEIGSGIPISNKTFVPYDEAPAEFENIMKNFKKRNSQDKCSKLLQRFGWGSGVRIPFASKENQALEKNLEFKQRKILALQTELFDHSEHAKALEKHLAKVQEDNFAVLELLSSKKSVLEEERSYVGMSERIFHKALKEKRLIEKNIKETKKRSNVMQKGIDRRLKLVLELRDIVEFDSEALKEYRDRLRIFSEISSDVARLSIEDQKSIRDLEDAKVELGAQKKELRHQLDQEAMNTAKYQEQFDRLCIEFRKVHRQRQDMITMWASTIQAMSDKDTYMKDIADEFFSTKKLLREIADSIEDKERRLKLESCGIRGTELFLSELDRRLEETRRRAKDENELHLILKDSCALCQLEVQSATNQTKTLLEGLLKFDADIKVMVEKANKVKKIVQELIDKLKEIEMGRSNADMRMTALEQILNEEEDTCEKLLGEMNILRKYYWERTNDKAVNQAEILTLETSIQRMQTNLEVMQNKEANNMDYVGKRSGKIYRLDLDCSILENRISRMMNQSIDPRYFDLQNSLRELKEAEKKIDKDRKYIAFELEHVENLTAKCNSDIGKNKRHQIILEADLQQCDMNTHGLEKLMTLSMKEFNDEQVRQSLERVYLKRLADQLKSERERMFGLSEIKNTIHWAVKERKAEIENHRVLNLSRHKALSVSVSKLRVQAGELDYRTCRLRGRFELITKLMADSNETDPEHRTLAYQVRKIARERETFQTECQRWKIRLEEAEKELEGLLNVYKILSSSNSSLKESLSAADEQSEERMELDQLNQQEQEIMLRRNRAKKYRAILQDRTEELLQQIANMDQELHATFQLRHVKHGTNAKLDNEMKRQKEKLIRWTKMCGRILREIKENVDMDQFDMIQMDLKLRFTNSKLDSAIAMMQRVLSQFQYVALFVNNYLIRPDGTPTMLFYRINKISPPHSSDSSSGSSNSPRRSRSFTPITIDDSPSNPQTDSRFSEDRDPYSPSEEIISRDTHHRMRPQSRLFNSHFRLSETDTTIDHESIKHGKGNLPKSSKKNRNDPD